MMVFFNIGHRKINRQSPFYTQDLGDLYNRIREGVQRYKIYGAQVNLNNKHSF